MLGHAYQLRAPRQSRLRLYHHAPRTATPAPQVDKQLEGFKGKTDYGVKLPEPKSAQ